MVSNRTYDSNAGTVGKQMGPARWFAILFGVTYLLVAALEVYLGATDQAIRAGGTTILEYAVMHNLVHWLIGLLVLGSFFAGEPSARIVARFVGALFVVVTLMGVLAPALTGDLLGYGHPVNWIYNAIHALTAAAGLIAGFIGTHARHGTTVRNT